MSTMAYPSEQEFPTSPNARQAFRVSLNGILIFAALFVAMATAAAFLYYQQQPWVEIVGKDLLRTNAPSGTIASARDVVIQEHQNWIVGEDGKRSDPSYQGGARTWSVGPSPEDIRVKVIRGKTQITDKNAVSLSIESISVTDTPTLVFIHYDNPSGKQDIVNDLVNELVKRGVKMR